MKKILLLFSILCSYTVYCQSELVFVYFKDKPNKALFYANPLSELSQKSLDRRAAQGIALSDQDAPIELSYLEKVQNLGFTVTDYSKWLNGVALYANSSQVQQLLSQNFVKNIESFAKNSQVVKQNQQKSVDKFKEFKISNLTSFTYGNAAAQIDQINLRNLHEAGFTGSGITIAVIDTGFPTVNTGSTYQRLRDANKIKGGYNFIEKNTDIYDSSLNAHGSYVLGSIAGYIENTFVGSAPDADFYLYATEIGPVEIPEEQIYWIEAAEEADRMGVDVINSSLGYTTFDNPMYNYTYADMNGTTSFISRGAQIASEKGIIVVSSAGNSGAQPWHYISAPADNAKVFTIGAVDASGNASTFSSFGPNANGTIKPDVAARGTNAATTFSNSAAFASGTSLSSPIAAGGIACLLQSLPAGTSRDLIKNSLRETASLYPSHDDQRGFGILNFAKAKQQIINKLENSNALNFALYPNPAKDRIYFRTSEKIIKLEIYDQAGRLVTTFSPPFYFIDVSNLQSGIYVVKAQTNQKILTEKLIKE